MVFLWPPVEKCQPLTDSISSRLPSFQAVPPRVYILQGIVRRLTKTVDRAQCAGISRRALRGLPRRETGSIRARFFCACNNNFFKPIFPLLVGSNRSRGARRCPRASPLCSSCLGVSRVIVVKRVASSYLALLSLFLLFLLCLACSTEQSGE